MIHKLPPSARNDFLDFREGEIIGTGSYAPQPKPPYFHAISSRLAKGGSNQSVDLRKRALIRNIFEELIFAPTGSAKLDL
jgi:hypothetical protein